MAKNPAKQFNLGIHKIPSFRFYFYKKHNTSKNPVVLTPAAVVVFYPWPGLPFFVSAKRHAEVWPWARLIARIPRKLNWTMPICLHPKTPRKTWGVLVCWLHSPKLLGVKGFQQKRGSLRFHYSKEVSRDFETFFHHVSFTAQMHEWVWSSETNEMMTFCGYKGGIVESMGKRRFLPNVRGDHVGKRWGMTLGGRILCVHVSGDEVWTRTPAKLVLCSDLVCVLASQSNSFVFMVYTDFFPSSKIQFWHFWERTSSKSFKRFHIIFHCSVSNLASVSPREQPQTIIHRNRHVFLWDRIPTNPHPFSVGFLWRSGNFSGSMLSGYIAPKCQNKRGSTGTGISFLKGIVSTDLLHVAWAILTLACWVNFLIILKNLDIFVFRVDFMWSFTTKNRYRFGVTLRFRELECLSLKITTLKP